MRRHYPLHIHISTLFLTLILVVCGVLGSIGYKLLVAAMNRGYLARKDGGEWLTVGVNKKGAD